MDASDPYTAHAQAIESILAYTRRANRLTPDDADEFISWARLKLIENDHRILRSFKGVATIETFLLTVIRRLFHDWRNHEWGRWRPTTIARRLGPMAIELERLVIRDQIDYEQACGWLLSKGVAQSRAECDEIWGRLPRRGYRRSTGDGPLEVIPAPTHPDQLAIDEQRARAVRASDALERSLPTLPAPDQLLIRWRFQDGFSVARIAKLIGQEQKPLYRRIEQILLQLRRAMADAGVPPEEMRDLFGNPVVEFPPAFPKNELGTGDLGPSSSPNAGGVQ